MKLGKQTKENTRIERLIRAIPRKLFHIREGLKDGRISQGVTRSDKCVILPAMCQ